MTTKAKANNAVRIDAEALFSEVNHANQPIQGVDLIDGLPQVAIDFLTAERRQPSAEDEAAWSLVCEIKKLNKKLLELGKNANQSNTERIATWDYEEKLRAEIEELEFKLRGASAVDSTNKETTPDIQPLNAEPIETPEVRRARWLAMYEKNGGANKRGALAALALELNVDRSNLKKKLTMAEKERDEKRREGTFGVAANQLVRNGKRQT